MASETNRPSDATKDSSSQAPETAEVVEGREPPGGDYRLWPGGAHGAHVDTGMSSLDDQAMASDPHRSQSLIPNR